MLHSKSFLLIYFMCSSVSVNPILLIYPSPLPFLVGNYCLFPMSVNLFLGLFVFFKLLLFFYIYLFYLSYFWLHWVFAAALGFSLLGVSRGHSCYGVWASHCYGLSCCGARALGVWASVFVARRLSSCGARA